MNTGKRLWILEDDADCVELYRTFLDKRYETRYFDAIQTFVEALKDRDLPEMCIIDLNVKDGCFLDFLAASDNKAIFDLPFIIVSALADVDALRFCFEEGAIDYIVKPFHFSELIVKLERLMSEEHKPHNASVVSDPHGFDGLTGREIHILKLFLEYIGRPVSRQTLVQSIWKETSVHPKTLDVHLYNLRKKLQQRGLAILSPESGKWMLVKDPSSSALEH